MDLEHLAGYLAATSILSNIDSYIGMPHNYYLLLDNQDNKIHLLPWDVNEVFGTFSMGRSIDDLLNWDINRPWVSELRLLEKLFATDTFLKLYHASLKKLMRVSFTEEKLNERIRTFEKVILPYIEATDSVSEIIAFDMAIDGDDSGVNMAEGRPQPAIKPFIRKRIESIQKQLDGKKTGTIISARGGRPGF